MAPVNGDEAGRHAPPKEDIEEDLEQRAHRRARARRNAMLLALAAAAIYVGFILFGAAVGIFPG